MGAVGGIGLAVNIISMMLLRAGSRESLNVKGAYFEVVADAAGSFGVIEAGLLVATTVQTMVGHRRGGGDRRLRRRPCRRVGRQILAVLGQHVPEGMTVDQIVADLETVDGEANVDDLHVWTLTSGMNGATAHLILADHAQPQTVLTQAQGVLARSRKIERVTLQTETAPTQQCHEVTR